MQILKSLASLQKRGIDKVDWLDREKNIYDEDVDVVYTFRVFGIPLFKYNKVLDTKHKFDREQNSKVVAGFNSHVKK